MTSVLMSLLAYGPRYAKLFTGPSLTAWLDPSNLPAVKDRVAFECYTDQDTLPVLEAHENVQRLRALGFPVVFHTLPHGSTTYEKRYELQSVTFQRALHRAHKADQALMVLTADMVPSTGYVPKLLSRLDEGYDSVQGIYLRCTAETLSDPLATLGRAMGPAEMWQIGRGALHPLALTSYWDAPDFSNIPYWLMWGQDNLLVLRCLTITTIVAKVSKEMLSAPRNVPDAMVDPYLKNPYVNEDWTECPAMLLEHLSAFYPTFRPGPSNVLGWIDWARRAAPDGSLKNLQRTFKLYDAENPPADADVQRIVAASDVVVRDILERTGVQQIGQAPEHPLVESIVAQPEYAQQVEGRHGRFLVNVNDMFVGKSLVEYGEFSKEEGDLFASIVTPGMTVVEVGANIGAHTVQLSKLVGQNGLVIAYEPQRLVYQMLCANLQLNSLANVHALNMAVGESKGVIPIPDMVPTEVQNFGGFEVSGHAQGTPTAVAVLDDLARCDFLKVDCEGMELQVLKGASDLIRRCKPIMYMENDRPDKAHALIAYVESLGYSWDWHHALLYSPDNYKANPVNYFGATVSANMLCRPRVSRTSAKTPSQS